jgi:LuxR family maltose regulon positive regulatory protein
VVKSRRLTVDELARAVGCSVRNVRALQSAGILPGPELRGRTGYYGEEHVRRLVAVQQLQAEGFSLAALRVLLRAYDEGDSLEEVLGLPPRPPRPARRGGARQPAPDPFDGFAGRRRPGRLLAVVPTSVLDCWPGEAAYPPVAEVLATAATRSGGTSAGAVVDGRRAERVAR